MSAVNVLAIVGSLRLGSANAATSRAALAVAPDGVSITVFDVGGLPLYNGDEELAGPPAEVVALHEAAAANDAILLFSPEYNGSFPAVTKNVIDWLSRPPTAWEGTAVTVVATSPGPRAGLGMRTHFTEIMEHQPIRLFETLGIGRYGDKMVDGELTDAATLDELAEFIGRFADFARSDVD